MQATFLLNEINIGIFLDEQKYLFRDFKKLIQLSNFAFVLDRKQM